MSIGGSVIQGYFPGGQVRVTAAPFVPHLISHRPTQVGPLVQKRMPSVSPTASNSQVTPTNVKQLPTTQGLANGKAMLLPANLSSFSFGGLRLPETVQKKMEAVFHTSFADVRIHVGQQPASIGASAYTQGSNVYFSPGQYQPLSPQGQRLLGHELTHVVQQRAGRVRNPFGFGIALVQDAALETEAERMGEKIAILGRQHVAANTSIARYGTPRPTGGTLPIQRKVRVLNNTYHGNYAGLYDSANMVTLLNGIGTVMGEHYHGQAAKRGPLPYLHAPGTYTVNDITEIIDYMVDQNAGVLPIILTKTYGADHGDYHFTGHVTKKKAQWTILKATALQLMEDEIDEHMATLLAGTPENGWKPWYIGGDAGHDIGDTVDGSVSMFTIQLQVSKELKRNFVSRLSGPTLAQDRCWNGKISPRVA